MQHVGDASEQKTKCPPIRTRETGGARLLEELHALEHFMAVFSISNDSFIKNRGFWEVFEWSRELNANRYEHSYTCVTFKELHSEKEIR